MIRSALPSDAPRLADLAAQLAGSPVDAAALSKRLGRILQDPAHLVLVAEEEGRAVGWLHAFVVPHLGSADRAEVGGLVVDEASRGRGLGGLLMEAAEAWALARGLDTLRLRSRLERERAHAFYHRLGYGETKRQVVLEKRLES